MPENRFLAFSRDFIQFFSDFLHKDVYQECSKHDRVRFSKRVFFRPKMPEIYRKSPFLYIFLRLFTYISLFFSHKNINDISFFIYSLVRPSICLLTHSFVPLFALSLVHFSGSYPLYNVYICSQFSNFHYQVGPISMRLVLVKKWGFYHFPQLIL